MTEVGPSEPLGGDERFRGRVAVVVEPGHIIESGGSDYQDVAFPLSGRITQPRRWSIGLQRASVHIDLPKHGLDFMQDHDHPRRLDDAAWCAASGPVARDAVRQTVILRIVAAEVFGALVIESLGPRSHGTPSLRSAARSKLYLMFESHIPDRSGFPSAVRGVGAVRFGLPSRVRGTLGSRGFAHWADPGE